MSMVTKSTKRNRVYQRRFDHEEAQRRFAAGERLTSLAREFGVSTAAVRRVVVPGQRERMYRQSRVKQMSGVCVDCGKTGIAKRAKRCMDCSATHRLKTVRPTTLRCSICKEWLEDTAFRKGETCSESRRFRSRTCRECDSRARTEYRERNKVLCEGGCGKLVEGKGRPSRDDPNRPFLCLSCGHKLREPWWLKILYSGGVYHKEENDGQGSQDDPLRGVAF